MGGYTIIEGNGEPVTIFFLEGGMSVNGGGIGGMYSKAD